MVSDFGLAKTTQFEGDLTQTGTILGSPNYMSPEQATPGTLELSPLTDVHGIGGIPYFILVGLPPFRGLEMLDVLDQVRHIEPVRPTSLNPKIDRDLETICLKCLEKIPERRYESALAVAEDLERYLNGIPILARPAGLTEWATKWIRREPKLAALLSVSVLSLLTFIGVLIATNISTSIQQQKTAQALSEVESEQLATRRALWEANLSASRAHRWSNIPGYRFDALEAIEKAAGLMPMINPTDAEKAELRNELIATLSLPIDLKESKSWELESAPSSQFEVGFSPELNQYAIGFNDGTLRLVSMETGTKLFECTKIYDRFSSIRYSPDGKWLGVSLWNNDFVLFRMDPPGEGLEPVWKSSCQKNCFDFSPDGKKLVIGIPQGSIVSVDLESLKQSDEIASTEDSSWLRMDPRGQLIVLTGMKNARVIDLDSKQEVWHHDSPLGFGGANFNWDSSQIVVAENNGSVKIVEFRNDHKVFEIPPEHGVFVDAAFVPDSEYVVCRTHRRDLFVYTYLYKMLNPEPVLKLEGGFAQFGKQGRSVGFWTNSRVGLWDLAVSRHFAAPTLPALGFDVAFSPRIPICVGASQRGLRIWRTDNFLKLADLEIGPTECVAFNPENGGLITCSSKNGIQSWPVSLVGSRIELGPPEVLTESQVFRDMNFAPHRIAFSADGDVLACSSNSTLSSTRILVLQPGSRRKIFLAGDWPPQSLSLSPDGKFVTAGVTPGGRMSIWNCKTGETLKLLNAQGKSAPVFVSNSEIVVSDVVGGVARYAAPDWNRVGIITTLPWPQFDFSIPADICFTQKEAGKFEIRASDMNAVLAEFSAPEIALRPRQHVKLCDSGRWAVLTTGGKSVWIWNVDALRGELGNYSLDWPAQKVERSPLTLMPDTIFTIAQ